MCTMQVKNDFFYTTFSARTFTMNEVGQREEALQEMKNQISYDQSEAAVDSPFFFRSPVED